MHPIYNYLRHRKDVSLLLAAFTLLVIALFNPTIPVKRNIYSYIFAVDISQSMNVVDKTLNGKPVSRLVYIQDTLHKLVSELPCGTNVSIGLFAGVSVAALYTPIEVCENFDAINDTIDHFDWRTGWSGNSRIRGSMPVLAKTIRSFPAPAQVVFFTDGEEAPKLHVFNREDLSAFQGGDDWLLVGVGSDKGTPIPKFDEHNQLIGYWANESFAMQPGIAQISEANIGSRNDSVANGESDRYLSKLDETYLQDLAKEINGMYVRADSVSSILDAMKKQKPARRDNAKFELRWVLAALAGVLFIFAYLPKHPVNELKIQFRNLTSRKQAIKKET
ncbi:VWA domain-containing protein [Methylotenera sp.]|jgi:mxaL protein|uniref:VWA domain-containing protein n=1 Tax=Methylotenera sp. TaxID=2051956 RepID=UPI002737085E|nr:VWA domain-containing protein [Methylotenera sp.]MDP3210580.1 VWA domain-containing protein [Methylotenera sp.]MDP3776923.1 VWA domain-containing protein [Methylotenera sp.]